MDSFPNADSREALVCVAGRVFLKACRVALAMRRRGGEWVLHAEGSGQTVCTVGWAKTRQSGCWPVPLSCGAVVAPPSS